MHGAYRTVPYRTVPYRTVPYRTVPCCCCTCHAEDTHVCCIALIQLVGGTRRTRTDASTSVDHCQRHALLSIIFSTLLSCRLYPTRHSALACNARMRIMQ